MTSGSRAVDAAWRGAQHCTAVHCHANALHLRLTWRWSVTLFRLRRIVLHGLLLREARRSRNGPRGKGTSREARRQHDRRHARAQASNTRKKSVKVSGGSPYYNEDSALPFLFRPTKVAGGQGCYLPFRANHRPPGRLMPGLIAKAPGSDTAEPRKRVPPSPACDSRRDADHRVRLSFESRQSRHALGILGPFLLGASEA